MLRCVLFSSDTRLVTQIKTWVRPLEETWRVDVFTSIEEFKDYRNIDVEGQRHDAFEKDIAGGRDNQNIRLLIIDLEFIAQKPVQAIQDLQKLVRAMDLSPKVDISRVLVLAHEGGTHKLESLQNEAIDDVILKPLDRQLFLQKVEILSSDDPKVKPTFLFQAKTDMIIEVGKDIVVDEISEFGLSVRNPGPLNAGLFAAIHLELLGVGGLGRVLGRVYGSSRHPIRQGEYVVHFSFFGLTSEQLMNLRLFVKSQQTTMKMPKPVVPAIKGSRLLLEPEKIVRRIAVIDMNSQSLTEAADILESGFVDVNVQVFTSYSRLQNELLKIIAAKTPPVSPVPGGGSALDAPFGAGAAGAVSATAGAVDLVSALAKGDKAFPGGEKISAVIRGGGSYALVAFDPKPAKGDKIMARQAEEWTDRADLWFSSIEKEDREFVTELLAYTERGLKGKGVFRMLDGNGRVVFLEASGILEKSGDSDGASSLRLELKELDAKRYAELTGETAAGGSVSAKTGFDYRYDAIFIDAALVRPTPEEWYQSFVVLLRKSGAIGAVEVPPKIFIMSDERAAARAESFRFAGVCDFSRKPLDRRLTMLKTQALIPDLKLARELDTPPFVPVEMPAKLAKEVRLTEVSEFGIAVEQKSPFRDKVLMRFFSPLFADNGGGWVTGRALYCQKSGDDAHTCQFMFFGTSDDVLQRIRRWIREDYVGKKQGA